MMCTAMRPPRELVERGERARRDRRGDEARAVRDAGSRAARCARRRRRRPGGRRAARSRSRSARGRSRRPRGRGRTRACSRVDHRPRPAGVSDASRVPIMPMNSTGMTVTSLACSAARPACGRTCRPAGVWMRLQSTSRQVALQRVVAGQAGVADERRRPARRRDDVAGDDDLAEPRAAAARARRPRRRRRGRRPASPAGRSSACSSAVDLADRRLECAAASPAAHRGSWACAR